MRKFIFALMASLLSCSAVSAFWQEAVDSSLEIGVGYRQDTMKWKRDFSNCGDSYYGSSSSSGYGRKFKSELEWKDLSIWLIEARGKYVTCDNIYLRGSIDYGWITSGKAKHKFEDDCGSYRYGYNSFNASFDDDNHHVKGNVWDGKIAIGYLFNWCDNALSVAPVVGYSWHGNELRRGNCGSSYSSYSSSSYYDSYDYYPNYSGSYSDSYSYSDSSSSDYSSYSSGDGKHRVHQRWIGPFIGVDLDYRLCCDWNLFLSYEYHWADYHAKEKHGQTIFDFAPEFQDMCFRDETVRVHGKNGSGNVLNFGVQWDLCDCWTVSLRGEFQWWNVDHAHEHRKIDECSFCDHAHFERVLKTRIKEVTWNSGSVVLDFGMVF